MGMRVSLLILLVRRPFNWRETRLIFSSREAGDYTVILSTYEPDQMGKFMLKVESPSRFDIKAIPQEDAGMYVKTVRGEWYVQSISIFTLKQMLTFLGTRRLLSED